ncbi:MAG: calcium/sodium antiporter [Lachnospiraceae bacterium]|nr:calcium/sodium antiporter [bacterium]MDY5517138.1 calcium/sodium antiporter [Lachnospiraceae bacterium]
MHMLMEMILLVVGFAMLIKGADIFVEGAAGIAAKFGIPQLVIGLTIVAMGTSAPEAAVSIAAACKGTADITIGNVVGSNTINILVILGITALIVAVAVQQSTVRYEIPFVVLVSIVLLAMGAMDGVIGRMDGGILWVLFLVYFIYLFLMAKHGKEEEEAQADEPFWKLLVFVVFGIALIVIGADVSVDAASEIARVIGLSERFIGLTIVALGTSLPELCTSVVAATKGKADLAIGNIVGSNIFNILFVVGTTALIIPVPFNPAFIADSVVAIAAAVLLWICVLPKKKLTRPGGAVMLVGYAGYFAYLMMK